MAVELTHGEGVVGLEVVPTGEGVHTVGLVRVRHALHLVDLDGHAGGLVGSQAGPILVRSGNGTAVQSLGSSAPNHKKYFLILTIEKRQLETGVNNKTNKCCCFLSR